MKAILNFKKLRSLGDEYLLLLDWLDCLRLWLDPLNAIYCIGSRQQHRQWSWLGCWTTLCCHMSPRWNHTPKTWLLQDFHPKDWYCQSWSHLLQQSIQHSTRSYLHHSCRWWSRYWMLSFPRNKRRVLICWQQSFRQMLWKEGKQTTYLQCILQIKGMWPCCLTRLLDHWKQARTLEYSLRSHSNQCCLKGWILRNKSVRYRQTKELK